MEIFYDRYFACFALGVPSLKGELILKSQEGSKVPPPPHSVYTPAYLTIDHLIKMLILYQYQERELKAPPGWRTQTAIG